MMTKHNITLVGRGRGEGRWEEKKDGSKLDFVNSNEKLSGRYSGRDKLVKS